MEHKQSSVRQYDPAKPRRAKNLRDRDWEPMKATITEGHELGHTRTQILQSLEKRHKFFASPAQLNKQMARWGLRVKGKGRAAIEGEAGYWACEHMSASPAASEAADQKKSSASLHSREVQSSVDARATTLEAAADQLGRPCDAAAINQVDITAKQKANSSFDSTIRSQHGHCRDAASQNPQASIWKPDIEMSSEIVDGELPSNPFSTIMRMIREYRPSDAATKLLKTCYSHAQCECGNAELSSRCNLWQAWYKLGDAADCLASAECLPVAFDLYHLLFATLFSCSREILVHRQSSAVAIKEQSSVNETSAEVIAGYRVILQVLTKAAIGCATTCSNVRHVQHTDLLLDAALCFAVRMDDDPNTASSLATFFDFHREALAKIWPVEQRLCSESIGAPGACALREGLKGSYPVLFFRSFIRAIHPSIIDREFLFVCTHLSTSPHRSKVWLTPEFTTHEEVFAEFLRRVDPGSARFDGGEWDPKNAIYVSFIERYLTNVKPFLRWCSQVVTEWKSSGAGGFDAFCSFVSGSGPLGACSYEAASLRLYSFFVWRFRPIGREPRPLVANLPASLSLVSRSSAMFDALFVLSRLVLEHGGCQPPTDQCSLRLDGKHWRALAIKGVCAILLSPHKFVWHYLCKVAGLASGRRRALAEKVIVEQGYLRAAILAPSPEIATALAPASCKPKILRVRDANDDRDPKAPSDIEYSRESSPADAASTYCRTVFSATTFATSSSMSQDTRMFRCEARRYRETELVRRKHRPQVPSFQSSRDSEMDFELISGMPAMPTRPDVMVDAPEASSRVIRWLLPVPEGV